MVPYAVRHIKVFEGVSMREKTKEGFVIQCQRCGRLFVSRHANSKFCDLPSEHPEDNGRTCKELQRIESKRNERARGRKLKENIENGTYVMTAMYGIITRAEYVEKFQNHIMKKYGLKNYASFQQWTSKNAELLGNEYDEFQTATGLKRMEVSNGNEEQ